MTPSQIKKKYWSLPGYLQLFRGPNGMYCATATDMDGKFVQGEGQTEVEAMRKALERMEKK